MKINVLEYLVSTAERCPDKVAVADRAGSITFAELRDGARSLASELVRRGIGCNQPVGVYLPKSRQAILSFAAILTSGNIYVPLDVTTPAQRMRKILDTLKPAFVITTSTFASHMLEAGLDPRVIVLVESECEVLQEIDERHRQLIDTDPVYIIHTSGSTGIPKGVTVSHRGVIDYIDWALSVYKVDSSYTIGSQAPLYFDNSTLDIYLSWATGATLDFIPEEMFKLPVHLLEYMTRRGIDFIFWVPSAFASMVALDLFNKVAVPKLRVVLFAGEVMPARYLNYWSRHLPDALFSNLYGPTEITVDCTYWIADREIVDDEPVPIGFPCRNTDILILTPDNRLAGENERGELCVRGSSLALGYWNDPERTAAVFTQNPLQHNYPDRIYRTGDIVYRNKRGEIIFAGRNDSQIKYQGIRVELGEIETAVLSLREVQNACALFINSQIVLFFEAPQSLDPRWFRTELGAKLPWYMLPVVYQQLDELPLNSSGKIDRVQLRCSVEGTMVALSQPHLQNAAGVEEIA